MSADDAYLQFPLCALSCCADERERMELILSFGFIDAGFVLLERLASQLRKLKSDELAQCPGVPGDYRKGDNSHLAAMLGAQAIGINVGSVRWSVERWEKLSRFRDQFQAQHGTDATVRIRKCLVFEARDNTGISYREFSILAALVSCIGAKKYPVRITRQAIQCRSLGYKSPSVMAAEIGKRTDNAKPFTFRQINLTLDRLHERQFFARARANERQTFFSNRMSQDELEQALVNGRSYSREFHERRRQRDETLMAKIKGRRADIKANGLLK